MYLPLWSSFEDGKTRAQLLLLKHRLSLHYTREQSGNSSATIQEQVAVYLEQHNADYFA